MARGDQRERDRAKKQARLQAESKNSAKVSLRKMNDERKTHVDDDDGLRTWRLIALAGSATVLLCVCIICQVVDRFSTHIGVSVSHHIKPGLNCPHSPFNGVFGPDSHGRTIIHCLAVNRCVLRSCSLNKWRWLIFFYVIFTCYFPAVRMKLHKRQWYIVFTQRSNTLLLHLIIPNTTGRKTWTTKCQWCEF